MKKTILIVLTAVLVLALATVAFAQAYKSPAAIFSELTGMSEEESVELRGESEKSYGELADENGVLDEFKELNLENKLAFIEEKVADGFLTREDADAIIEKLESADCESFQELKLGQEYGLQYGSAFAEKAQARNGSGNGMQKGNRQQSADGSNFGKGNKGQRRGARNISE